jgi:beta-glucanase (GH16 family)
MPAKKPTGKKRSNKSPKGRRTTGSGGLKRSQQLNWRRALPLVLVLAVTGGYLVWRSFAAETAPKWKLHWSDEFNSTSLDTTRWSAYHNTYGDGNLEEACLTPQNVTVGTGSLKIVSKKAPTTCPGKPTDQFSSGFIGSREATPKRYYPAFARYEIRARVPHAQGLWPAFWLRHVNGSGTAEVDVMEYFHAQVPGKVTQTLHLPAEQGRNVVKKTVAFETPRSGSGDWHTFAVDILPLENGTKAQFVYSIDGKETIRYTPTKFGWLNNYDKNAMFDIALNTAVGGTWNGHPDDELGWSRYNAKNASGAVEFSNKCLNPSRYGKLQPCDGHLDNVMRAQFPATYEIDYVRVYVPDADQPAPEPAAPPVPTAPATPSSLKAIAGVQSASLSWNAVTTSTTPTYSVRYIRSDSTQKADGAAWTYPGRVSTTTQKISGLLSGVSYDFQVRAIDERATANTTDDLKSNYTSTAQTIPLAPEPTGLTGTYFNSQGPTGTATTRIDSAIDFDWGLNAPIPGVQDDFTVRWSGTITAPATNTYTITVASDDGMNLWLDGKLLINSWKSQYVTEKSATIQLQAGQPYTIEVDYFDSGGGAIARLFWQSSSLNRQIVPTSALRPITSSGLSGRYYGTGGLTMLRNDKQVDFNWGTATPQSPFAADGFIVSWIGMLSVPASGTYTLTTETDDGSALYVNGARLIDDLRDHAPKRNSATIYLEKGTSYPLTMYYYENKGGAVAKLLWSGPGLGEQIIPTQYLRTQ